MHKGKIVFVASILVIYGGTLVHNLNESQRRSLALKEAPLTGNQVDVSFQVISMNPVTSEMTTRVSFILSGDIAKDPVTPSVDLKFFVNGIMGPQETDFRRGQRMNPFIAVFAVDGNVNRYPLDSYKSLIRVLVMKSIVAHRAPAAESQSTLATPLPGAITDNFITVNSHEGEPLPLSSSISASIPGFKFDGQRVEYTDKGIEGFNIGIRRAEQRNRVFGCADDANDKPGSKRPSDVPECTRLQRKVGALAFIALCFSPVRPPRAPKFPACRSAAGSSRRLCFLYLGGNDRCDLCRDDDLELDDSTTLGIQSRYLVSA